LAIAHALNSAIAGSTLVVLPGAGHVCNIDAADEFGATVRAFLHECGT
jgi:pimeloyl-ACP methyl ester carboxylesterase